MAPRLSGQTSIFGVVCFVSKSLLGIERQRKLEKFSILTRKPRSHARILIHRTWPITSNAWIYKNGAKELHPKHRFHSTFRPSPGHVNGQKIEKGRQGKEDKRLEEGKKD